MRVRISIPQLVSTVTYTVYHQVVYNHICEFLRKESIYDQLRSYSKVMVDKFIGVSNKLPQLLSTTTYIVHHQAV